MSLTNRRRIKEVYFYKTPSGEYKVDLISGRNKMIKEPIYYGNRSEINDFIEGLQSNKNPRFEVSKLGIKIYNKKPDQRLLKKTPESLLNTYIQNLSNLQENSYYRHKVANLLRNVSDILDGDAPMDPSDPCTGSLDSEIDYSSDDANSSPVMPTDDPEYETEVPSITPDSPIDPGVPIHLILRIQDSLDTTLYLDDLTFWFQDQKWQLTKDGYEYSTPVPQKPKSSHNILGTMEYIINLLGVNAERNTRIGENSFRFTDEGNIYTIKHIYTGDHNTLRREI